MNAPAPENEWFADWFNSPYYHLLYKNRGEEEAAAFIRLLAAKLELEPGSTVLDLACGKGRHARTLHSLGMQVTGIDLSPESICEAQQQAPAGMEFYVHDMRRPFRIHYYNYVFNLFTSFGYFRSENENRKVLAAVRQGLKPGGKLIIDFFNGEKVRAMLAQPHDIETEACGVLFRIHKYADTTHVYKEIRFSDKGRDYAFTERVQLLGLAEFTRLLEPAFRIETCYGDYALGAFNGQTSDRLIIIASLS